jgi:hypothetical protein
MACDIQPGGLAWHAASRAIQNEDQILIVAISICWNGLCSGYEICVGCIGKRGEGCAHEEIESQEITSRNGALA